MFAKTRGRIRAWREAHPKTEALLFFALGFAFDLLMLRRIDSLPMLIHQGSYNLLLTWLVVVDHRASVAPSSAKGWRERLLKARHGLIHFLFGTLFNAYVVFYFRAASSAGALGFIALIALLLLANEIPAFRGKGPIVRFALVGFSWATFLAYLIPTWVGHLDPSLFYLAVGSAALISLGVWWVSRGVAPDPRWTVWRGVLPALTAQGVLLLLYALRVIPPVPLALQTFGVAYEVTPRAGRLDVATLSASDWWSDVEFRARPGDRVFVYTRIFAPRRFKDTLYVRWQRHDRVQGWLQSDRIPLTIAGGERDWRGWAYKKNHVPGQWRVTVETDDERVLGQLSIDIVADTETSTRTFRRLIE